MVATPRRVNSGERRYDLDHARSGRIAPPGMPSAGRNRRRLALSPTENAPRLVAIPDHYPSIFRRSVSAPEKRNERRNLPPTAVVVPPREPRPCPTGYPVPAPASPPRGLPRHPVGLATSTTGETWPAVPLGAARSWPPTSWRRPAGRTGDGRGEVCRAAAVPPEGGWGAAVIQVLLLEGRCV